MGYKNTTRLLRRYVHPSQILKVAQLKAEVSRLKEEQNAAQKAIADLHQQNQALRQKVLTPEKCDRFLTESFRVTEFP
jgi:cell division protein FtsB